MNKKMSKQTGQMTPLERAEARLQAVAGEAQAERRRRDELAKKREAFTQAVAEAKAQRESYAYQAHAQDDPEAMKILAEAQRRTREAEDALHDLDTAAAICEARVTDLEAKQEERQHIVAATTAAAHGGEAVDIAADLDPITQQLVSLLAKLESSIEAARGHGQSSLENDTGGPPPFWQLTTRVYLRYLLALLIQERVFLLEPTSPEVPTHDERKEFVRVGSFRNYMAGLVEKGVRRLKLDPLDFEGEEAA